MIAIVEHWGFVMIVRYINVQLIIIITIITRIITMTMTMTITIIIIVQN